MPYTPLLLQNQYCPRRYTINDNIRLYKEFAIDCLFLKTFRYYLDNEQIIDVQFKEWAMKHLWAIHHIDSRIDKDKLFEEIDNGLSISHFRATPAMRKKEIK